MDRARFVLMELARDWTGLHPTGCLHFGTKSDMVQFAGLPAKHLGEQSGFTNAGVYDPASIKATCGIYVLHDIMSPERYGLPAKSGDSGGGFARLGKTRVHRGELLRHPVAPLLVRLPANRTWLLSTRHRGA